MSRLPCSSASACARAAVVRGGDADRRRARSSRSTIATSQRRAATWSGDSSSSAPWQIRDRRRARAASADRLDWWPTSSCAGAAERRPGMPSTRRPKRCSSSSAAMLPPPPVMCDGHAVGGLGAGLEQHLGERQVRRPRRARPRARCGAVRDASSSDTRRSGWRRARTAAARSRPVRRAATRRGGACRYGRRRAAAPTSAVRRAAWRARDARAGARSTLAASPRTMAVCSDAVAMRGCSASSRSARPAAPPVAQRTNSSFAASNVNVRASTSSRSAFHDAKPCSRAIDRLRVVQGEIGHGPLRRRLRVERRQDGEAADRCGIAVTCGAQERLRLGLQVIEIRGVQEGGVGIVRPPCLLLRFASRRHGGVRPTSWWHC